MMDKLEREIEEFCIAEEAKIDEIKACTTQACLACRQDVRNRFAACLQAASSEEQKGDCRRNYQRDIKDCVD